MALEYIYSSLCKVLLLIMQPSHRNLWIEVSRVLNNHVLRSVIRVYYIFNIK